MSKTITFADRVRIQVAAGNGGNGCASFRREKFVPRGGPDGGDGGRGGHVYLRADVNQDSLLDLYYQPHQRAGHGGHGRGQQCFGKDGADLYIRVPPGTEARRDGSGELVGEVVAPGQEILIARGGRGGLGNVHFKSSTNRAPRRHTEGVPGETMTLWLELKVVADVGLVGYPNAGKSTLLRALTAARPKTAAYPFTTLHPIIGTLEYEDYKTLRIADIPGLIEGAHQGVGLGHDFLRHIERTRFLLFVIDMAGTDGRDPTDDYRSLRREMKRYRADLDTRPFLVVANKMDLDAARTHLPRFKRRTRTQPLPLSAETKAGADELKMALYRQFFEPPPPTGTNKHG
jgi:GTP-binding protein